MSNTATPTDNRWRGIDFKAALLAGLIAGVVDLALLAGIALGEGNAWVNMRMTAAILMGRGVLPPPATFDPLIFVVSSIVHFGLSAIYGVIVAWFVRNSDWRLALMIGVAVGFGIYVVNYYIFAPLLFPWMSAPRSGMVSTLVHPVFGVVAAAAYIWLRRRPLSRTSAA
jgi:hypothetical protein